MVHFWLGYGWPIARGRFDAPVDVTTLVAPSKRLSSRRSSIFEASGFGPAMPSQA
jgi:hypothetical protein